MARASSPSPTAMNWTGWPSSSPPPTSSASTAPKGPAPDVKALGMSSASARTWSSPTPPRASMRMRWRRGAAKKPADTSSVCSRTPTTRTSPSTPPADLTAKQKRQLWQGTRSWKGMTPSSRGWRPRATDSEPGHAQPVPRTDSLRPLGKPPPTGSRLCPDRRAETPRSARFAHRRGLAGVGWPPAPETEQEIGQRLLLEIRHRLQFLLDVGLGYLTLNRAVPPRVAAKASAFNSAPASAAALSAAPMSWTSRASDFTPTTPTASSACSPDSATSATPSWW